MAVDKGKSKSKKTRKQTDVELQAASVQATLELVQVVRLDTLHKLLAEVREGDMILDTSRLTELIAEARAAQDNIGISDAPLPLVDGDDGMPEGDL